MIKTTNVKKVLFDYVKDHTTWFYWYHNPDRLKALFDEDHKGEPDYKPDKECRFTKKVWRFKKSNTVKDNIAIEKNLADFFDAVLDEVRIKKANAFAEYALYISDNEDLAYFRDTVTRREIATDIDYNKQRDHAVHTLYNYLLGWYLFEHSATLRDAFKSHFEKILQIDLVNQNKNLLKFYKAEKKTDADGTSKNIMKFCGIEVSQPEKLDLIAQVHEFADVWPIASLLHDIGYILEGSLSSADPNVEHLRVTNGSKIIHDYFNHFFWKSFEVDFRVAKNVAKTLGVVVPDFKYSQSLASLGDRLCDIGSCENIRLKLVDKIVDSDSFHKSIPHNTIQQDLNPYKTIQQKHGLNREAFSIWKEHYNFYKKKKMEDILYIVERVYKNMMWVGADHGNRNLDHGVCSGLITLQALTFFRELFWGFCQTQWLSKTPTENDFSKKQEILLDNTCDRVSEELYNHIKDEITRVPKRIMVRMEFGDINRDKCCKLRADFWFKKVLWATASSAIHSIIQQPEYRKECKKHLDNGSPLKINFDDDPLAFLGILVDSLQEWDRYTVKKRGEAAFSETELLQSFEVVIFEDTNQKIKLKYPTDGKDWVKELENKMIDCLENWTAIVGIEGGIR